MADKRRTNKKETKKKRCIVGQGEPSNRKLQRSPLKWDGNRTCARAPSLTHSLIARTKFGSCVEPSTTFYLLVGNFASFGRQFFAVLSPISTVIHRVVVVGFSLCWVWLMNRNACLSLALSGATQGSDGFAALLQLLGLNLFANMQGQRNHCADDFVALAPQKGEWVEKEPADWVRGQMRGRYCLLPWGICVRASGREEATRILQGLRIFPRFYYCVWLMLQVR